MTPRPASVKIETPIDETIGFIPIKVMDIEIGEPLTPISCIDPESGQVFAKVLALVRLHSEPLGNVVIPFNGSNLDGVYIGQCIWSTLNQQIRIHLLSDGIEADGIGSEGIRSTTVPLCLARRSDFLAHAPTISVIIATHNRTASLARTLNSIMAMQYPAYDVIVVDNAPSNDATRELISQRYPTVQYIREIHAGLATAHNTGLSAASASLVAFTDDDVEVDKYWLTAIAEAFDLSPRIACVTGMILPAELCTPAQVMIEEYGYSKGFTRRIFDLKGYRDASILYPYTAGVFGSGANMAYRVASLREVGRFDPALGAGSLAMGGDDLAGFYNIVTGGYQLVYQPASILRHWHRREYDALLRQAFGYGAGLTAYLTSVIFHQPRLIFDMAIRAPFGVVHALRLRSANPVQRTSYPAELTHMERRGMLSGPVSYIRSRRKNMRYQRLKGRSADGSNI